MDFFALAARLRKEELKTLASLCAGMALLVGIALTLSSGFWPAINDTSSQAAATWLGDIQGVPSGYTGNTYPMPLNCYDSGASDPQRNPGYPDCSSNNIKAILSVHEVGSSFGQSRLSNGSIVGLTPAVEINEPAVVEWSCQPYRDVTYTSCSSRNWFTGSCMNSTNHTYRVNYYSSSNFGPITGTTNTAALSSDTTVTLNCSGAGGSVNFTVPVHVDQPSISMVATPPIARYPVGSIISWTTRSMSSCTLSGPGIPPNTSGRNGSASNGALLTLTNNYTLNCVGRDGGNYSSGLTAYSISDPTITLCNNIGGSCSSSAWPASYVTTGKTGLFSWWVDADPGTCTAINGNTGQVLQTGKNSYNNVVVGPITQKTTFTVNCSSLGTPVSSSAEFRIIPDCVATAAGKPITGWVWADSFGWMSASGSDYGLRLQDDNTVTGYAWSDRIGWVQFCGLSSFPSGPGTQSVNARMSDSNHMAGWARMCSGTLKKDCTTMENNPDIAADGWISLAGSNHSLGVDASSYDSNGVNWAWGSPNVGWLASNLVIPPTVSVWATPLEITTVGGASIITWRAVNIVPGSCQVSNSADGTVWTGDIDYVGKSTGPLQQATTYTLTCTNKVTGIPMSASVTVAINIPCDTSGTGPVTSCTNQCAFRADSNEISPEQQTQIHWCCPVGPSIGQGFDTGGSLSGSASVGTGNYKLICPVGAGSQSIKLVPPSILSFTATPSMVRLGGTSVLTWSTKGMSSCNLTNSQGQVFSTATSSPQNGGLVFINIVTSEIYTLSCKDMLDEPFPSASIKMQLIPNFKEV